MTKADLACAICGARVADVPTHARWHKVVQLHVLVDESVSE